MEEIPIDLHPSILSKLPSKPLLEFLTVSKSWYHSIKHPNFIDSHLHHHKSLSRHPNHRLLLLRCHRPSLTFYLYRYDNPNPRRAKLRTPPGKFEYVVASYDGFVCLSDIVGNIMLWNPSINKFRCIEPSPKSQSSGEFVFGFGYNSLEDNYKLVLINYDSMSSDISMSEEIVPTASAHIYSLNRREEGMDLGWNQVLLPDFFPNNNLSRISECCFVNGIIHWIVFRGFFGDGFWKREVGASIMTFDPKTDCFGEIKLPTVISEAVDPKAELAVIGDALTVVHMPGKDESGLGSGDDNVVVWRMEEYGLEKSWKVLYRIKVCNATNKEIWAKEEGKVIITTSSGTLIVCNVNTENSGVINGSFGMTGGKAYGCTESLVLLD